MASGLVRNIPYTVGNIQGLNSTSSKPAQTDRDFMFYQEVGSFVVAVHRVENFSWGYVIISTDGGKTWDPARAYGCRYRRC